MRKQILLCCLFVCIILPTQAQKWHTDFEEAKKIAQEKNRRIILVFQASDWNGLCIRLNKEMWTNPEFIKYANDNYVMLKADFPRRKENQLSKEQKEKNEKLSNLYNRQRILPHVVVLNSKGDELGFTGYKKIEPYQYIELLNFFKDPAE